MCIHRTASKYVLWFSFNKMLHRDKNVLFGAVYIPPQGLKYSDINSFDEIETEFFDPYQNNIYDVCFYGILIQGQKTKMILFHSTVI